MDLIGQALARRQLAADGYITAFDCEYPTGDDADAGRRSFDVVGLRIEDGRVCRVVVAAIRGWWSPSAYLTPSLIRLHLLPGLADELSDENVSAFQRRYGLAGVPVEKALYYSQASPEKAEEAEAILERYGIRTLYLDRLAAQLVLETPVRDAPAEPLLTQLRALLRGVVRDRAETTADRSTVETDKGVRAVEDPQLTLRLFGDAAPRPSADLSKRN